MRALLFLCVVTAAGCGNKSTHREPDEYTGCGTDEHWMIFDDNQAGASVGSAQAPAVTQPPAGTTQPSSTKLVLQWNQDPNDPGMNAGDVSYLNGPGCNMCCPQFNTGALTTLHEPPVSGDVYDLQFTVAGSLVWRVVTTLQEWTPPDSLWAQWKGKTVAVKIYRLSLLVNQLKQGPYVAATPFSFSVGN